MYVHGCYSTSGFMVWLGSQYKKMFLTQMCYLIRAHVIVCMTDNGEEVTPLSEYNIMEFLLSF
jgi:hypothetical protein